MAIEWSKERRRKILKIYIGAMGLIIGLAILAEMVVPWLVHYPYIGGKIVMCALAACFALSVIFGTLYFVLVADWDQF